MIPDSMPLVSDAAPRPPDWDPQAIVKLLGNNQARNQRLLAKFLLTADDTIASMQGALDAGDFVELTRLAHGLKSSARSVGAMALGAHCEALEMAGRSGFHADVSDLVGGVAALFSVAKVKIQAQL